MFLVCDMLAPTGHGTGTGMLPGVLGPHHSRLPGTRSEFVSKPYGSNATNNQRRLARVHLQDQSSSERCAAQGEGYTGSEGLRGCSRGAGGRTGGYYLKRVEVAHQTSHHCIVADTNYEVQQIPCNTDQINLIRRLCIIPMKRYRLDRPTY